MQPKQSNTLTYRQAMSLEYPYMWLRQSVDDLNSAFASLINYSAVVVQEDYTILNLKPSGSSRANVLQGNVIKLEYCAADKLTSYFNQHIRVKCKRSDERLSPLDYWRTNKHVLIKKTNPLTLEALDRILFEQVKGCGQFKPCILMHFINTLKPKSILDFSSGWGDRLMAVLAANKKSLDIHYTGVDPNKELVSSYKAMLEMFSDNHCLYRMIAEPFESATLTDMTYDLVFTSPPYFGLEIYSNDASQSYQPGMKIDEWKQTFLLPSLLKAWNALNRDGTMCIVINDTKCGKCVEAMIEYITTFKDASPVELLSYSSGRYKNSHQPMWLWKKK